MKRYVRYRLSIASALLLVVVACNGPAEESATAPATEQPGAAAATDQNARPAAPAANRPANTAPAPAPAAPRTLRIPAGATLEVTMIDAIGTDTNQAGDTFFASIATPVVVNGQVALAKGTKVQGRIEALDEPGRVKGRAAITLVLTQIVGGDRPQNITTEPFSAVAEADTKSDAVKVGGGAAIGALIGAVAGGKKGAATGAAIGGGAGVGTVLATKGSQLRFESESKVDFVLRNAVDVQTTKSTS